MEMRKALDGWVGESCAKLIPQDISDRQLRLLKDVVTCQCNTNGVRVKRVFAMPSKDTFTIKPIRELLDEYVLPDELWIDPFAGYNSPATITNDINPGIDTDYHMDALDFLKMFSDNSVDGVLYDPPYNAIQAKLQYGAIATSMFHGKGSAFTVPAALKNEISRIIKPGGKAICFGWTTMGINMSRGFALDMILDVIHGGSHNDTLVTLEYKRV